MKKSKKIVAIGVAMCVVMISMMVSPALAYTHYCYGWYRAEDDVTGVMSYVKLTSAVYDEPGASLQRWGAIAVVDKNGGSNPYNMAEINLVCYETDEGTDLYFTAQAFKQGDWEDPVTSSISVANLDTTDMLMGLGKNGNVWQYYYSLDNGVNWNLMRSFNFGYSWDGEGYLTTFETKGLMDATSPLQLAGETTGILYQDNGDEWEEANLDTVWDAGADPQLWYAHGDDYENAKCIG